MKTKPKVLRDLFSQVAKKRFWRLPRRVNLNPIETISIPLLPAIKGLIILGVFSSLVFGSALAPVGHNQLSLAAESSEERAALEKQLVELESQMNEYQTTIDKYKGEGKNLQGDIDRLNANIKKINLQIQSITLSLKKLDTDITVTTHKITDTEQKIDQNQEILMRSLQHVYINENLTIVEILLRRPKLSDFFADVSDMMEIQEGMRVTLEKVRDLRVELIDEKEALALKKYDTEQLRAYQENQKASLNDTKSLKASILDITKGQEARYNTLLKETQKTAVQIRSRIFSLLGGGEMSFEEAYDFARFAEKETGIRAALLLAVLDRESALGGNVGKCPYYDQLKDKYNMHPTRDVPIFLELIERLKSKGDAPPEPILVSCPNRDGIYGGAMGPAQFIPSTWKLYEANIADITGSNPPSPWRNSDAFTGTALYLKDAYNSQACKSYANENSHISPKQLLQERCAAAKYYAGGRWYTYRWAYGQPTLDRADRFEKDIDILNS